jgi:hypothetical protein
MTGKVDIVNSNNELQVLEEIEQQTSFNYTSGNIRRVKSFQKIVVGAFMLLAPEVATPIIINNPISLNTLHKYEQSIDKNLNVSLSVDEHSKESVNLVDSSLDIISLSNEILADSKPLTGEALQHLSDYFDMTAKSKPSLPNRL